LLQTSLSRTMINLEKDFGENLDDWQWGDYHKVQFYHPLSNIHPILAYFFNNEKQIPVDGSGVTPMAASYSSETGEVDHGASWRFVIDLDDIETGRHIVGDRKSTRLNSSHVSISYAVFCLKKKNKNNIRC